MASQLYGFKGGDVARIRNAVRSVERLSPNAGLATENGVWGGKNNVPHYPIGDLYPFGIKFRVEATSCGLYINSGVLHFDTLPTYVEARKFNIVSSADTSFYHIVFDKRSYGVLPNVARVRVVQSLGMNDFVSEVATVLDDDIYYAIFLVEDANDYLVTNTSVNADIETALSNREIADWKDLIVLYTLEMKNNTLIKVHRHDLSSGNGEYSGINAVEIIEENKIVLKGDKDDEQWEPANTTGMYIRSNDANLVEVGEDVAYKFVRPFGSVEFRGTSTSTDPTNEEGEIVFSLYSDLPIDESETTFNTIMDRGIRFYGMGKAYAAETGEYHNGLGWRDIAFVGALGMGIYNVTGTAISVSKLSGELVGFNVDLKNSISENGHGRVAGDLVYTYRASTDTYGWTSASSAIAVQNSIVSNETNEAYELVGDDAVADIDAFLDTNTPLYLYAQDDVGRRWLPIARRGVGIELIYTTDGEWRIDKDQSLIEVGAPATWFVYDDEVYERVVHVEVQTIAIDPVTGKHLNVGGQYITLEELVESIGDVSTPSFVESIEKVTIGEEPDTSNVVRLVGDTDDTSLIDLWGTPGNNICLLVYGALKDNESIDRGWYKIEFDNTWFTSTDSKITLGFGFDGTYFSFDEDNDLTLDVSSIVTAVLGDITIPTASNAMPVLDAGNDGTTPTTGGPGTATTFSRSDHYHPFNARTGATGHFIQKIGNATTTSGGTNRWWYAAEDHVHALEGSGTGVNTTIKINGVTFTLINTYVPARVAVGSDYKLMMKPVQMLVHATGGANFDTEIYWP